MTTKNKKSSSDVMENMTEALLLGINIPPDNNTNSTDIESTKDAFNKSGECKNNHDLDKIATEEINIHTSKALNDGKVSDFQSPIEDSNIKTSGEILNIGQNDDNTSLNLNNKVIDHKSKNEINDNASSHISFDITNENKVAISKTKVIEDNFGTKKISINVNAKVTDEEIEHINNSYYPCEKSLKKLLNAKLLSNSSIESFSSKLFCKNEFTPLQPNIDVIYINDTESFMKYINNIFDNKYVTFFMEYDYKNHISDMRKIAIITEKKKYYILDLFEIDISKLALLLEAHKPIKIFYSTKNITKWASINNIKINKTYDILYALKLLLNGHDIKYDLTSVVKFFYNYDINSSNKSEDFILLEKAYFTVLLRKLLNSLMKEIKLMDNYNLKDNIIKALANSELNGLQVTELFNQKFKDHAIKNDQYYPHYNVYSKNAEISNDLKMSSDLSFYNGIFKANDNNKLITGSYEDLQMRLCLELSNIEEYIQVLIDNKDIYKYFSSKIYAKSYDEINSYELELTSIITKAIIQNLSYTETVTLIYDYLKKDFTEREIYEAYLGFIDNINDLYSWIRDSEYNLQQNINSGILVTKNALTHIKHDKYLYTYLKLIENSIIRECIYLVQQDIDTFNDINRKFKLNIVGLFKSCIAIETDYRKSKVAVNILNDRMMEVCKKTLINVPVKVNTVTSQTIVYC